MLLVVLLADLLDENKRSRHKNDKQKINAYVMYVNCAHSKGIRFIRDELKFFAKTNIHNKTTFLFNIVSIINITFLSH